MVKKKEGRKEEVKDERSWAFSGRWNQKACAVMRRRWCKTHVKIEIVREVERKEGRSVQDIRYCKTTMYFFQLMQAAQERCESLRAHDLEHARHRSSLSNEEEWREISAKRCVRLAVGVLYRNVCSSLRCTCASRRAKMV